MRIIPFTEFDNDAETQILFETDLNGREIRLHKFTDTSLDGYSLFYPEVLLQTGSYDSYILPYYEMTMSLKRGTRYESEGMVFEEESGNRGTIQIIEDPVFFFIYNSDNYFHFLYDTLPYLISYFKLKEECPQVKLLMNYPSHAKKEFYRFVIEFLELLRIDTEHDIIMANRAHLYKTLYLSSSYTHNGFSNSPPRNEVYQLYDDMVERASAIWQGSCGKNTPDRIYISRRTWIHNDLSNIGTNYTTRRKMMNEDKLVEVLVGQYGFTEVFTENLSNIQKIVMFRNAKVIVGAIGGGIANALFSKKDTKLVAIVSPCFTEINKRFHFSLDRTDLIYFDDTWIHESINGFSKYMRVKHKDRNVIGEIIELGQDWVKVAIGHAHGWNSELEYDQEVFKHEEIIKLDGGLNSPYEINTDKLCEIMRLFLGFRILP